MNQTTARLLRPGSVVYRGQEELVVVTCSSGVVVVHPTVRFSTADYDPWENRKPRSIGNPKLGDILARIRGGHHDDH